MTLTSSALGLGLLVLTMGAVHAAPPKIDEAPFINTWLVAGTFDNDAANSGYDRDFVGEGKVAPIEGADAGGAAWRYFDDRLFSRNYDDYQDLFSYYKIKLDKSVAAKVVYAFVYAYSERDHAVQLRVGADNEFKAFLNGLQVSASTKSNPHRDMVVADVSLRAGWNRLLLKIANQENGRLGFYARLCEADGGRVPGLTYSLATTGKLSVATKAMEDAATGALPMAFREWPYVGARPGDTMADSPDWSGFYHSQLWKPQLALHASDFQFLATGGQPAYKWSIADGALPKGLSLRSDGTIIGVVSEDAKLGAFAFTIKATDGAGNSATKRFTMTLKERPNRWFEATRLTALIHGPEVLNPAELPRFAHLMKRQGYGVGMVISYNNGDFKYRFPSMYEPNDPDVIGKFKAAIEGEGIKFGMYMGNLIGPNHGGDNGAILMVEEALRRYHPTAFWFDWASPTPDGYVSLDALYSMIRTLSPDTVIVLNGVQTMYQGDWDVVCLEGWGAWGKNHWGLWPFDVQWPKKAPIETWRLIADPAFQYSKGVVPDWQEYLRAQISLVGEGRVPNIDHSPTIATAVVDHHLTSLDDSVTWQAHEKMADWTDPGGIPPLYESYTQVDPGPLTNGEWGYNTINLPRDVIYLHFLKNPFGKTGMPTTPSLVVGPLKVKARAVVWMNHNKPVGFEQHGDNLTVHLDGLEADPIDTILKIELTSPHPKIEVRAAATTPVPPGNLAFMKPAKLLSLDGSHELVASGNAFARYGVDGRMSTSAEGAYEYPWAFHVDLQASHRVRRVVINFAATAWATEYKVALSEDGQDWREVAHVTGCRGGRQEHSFAPVSARYVRILGLKPDGPDQEGAQMAIAELEVYD